MTRTVSLVLAAYVFDLHPMIYPDTPPRIRFYDRVCYIFNTSLVHIIITKSGPCYAVRDNQPFSKSTRATAVNAPGPY
jgi:hypothetical protein